MSLDSDSGFQLPSIRSIDKKNKSPFKGFLDISIVHQKLRKSMQIKDGSMSAVASGAANFDFGSAIETTEKKKGKSKLQPVRASLNLDTSRNIVEEDGNNMEKIQPKGTRFAS